MEEKLEVFVDGRMTEEEFEQDSEMEAEVEVEAEAEAKAEAEADEVMGTEEGKDTGRTAASAMEVDEDSESEVVAVEEGQQSGGQKQVPSSPPKQLWKRACTVMATQTTSGSQAGMESAESGGVGCEQCVQQGIV